MLISHSRYSVNILLHLPNRKRSWVCFYPHGTELIFKTHLLCPRPRKRVQTSSRPSISDKYRKDLNGAELWGSGAGPTSISSSCWWPGAEGKLSIQYCIQLSGLLEGGGRAGGLRLAWRIISVARSELRLLSFRLGFGRASIRAGTGRGSRVHTCHGGNSCGPTQHH